MTYREFSERLVERVGARVQGARGNVLGIMQKGDDPRNEVTATDKEAHQILTDAIREAYPEHSVYSEEDDTHMRAGEFVWVLDPIDGTSNFARGIPHFAVCVGLLRGGVPIAGAVFNPATNELFSFEEEHGAFLNGAPIRTSSIIDLKQAQVFLHVGRKSQLWDWGAATLRSLLEGTKKVKDMGASGLDLSFLAAGRAEVVVYGMLTTRDVASAIGVVRAAGGEVYTPQGIPVDFSEEPQPIIATANKALFDAALPLLHTELLPR